MFTGPMDSTRSFISRYCVSAAASSSPLSSAACSAIKSSGWACSSSKHRARRCSRSESLRARSTSKRLRSSRSSVRCLAGRAQRVVHFRDARSAPVRFLFDLSFSRFQALPLGAQRFGLPLFFFVPQQKLLLLVGHGRLLIGQ